MNRPTPVKTDNFFLLIFHALRQRRVPLALRIASHSLLLVALALVIYAWVMGMQFKQAMQQQADALGQSLIVQTAASATELLVSNDILSLNVLLNNLTKNPLVAHAAIYSVDSRILAEAGARPHRRPARQQRPQALAAALQDEHHQQAKHNHFKVAAVAQHQGQQVLQPLLEHGQHRRAQQRAPTPGQRRRSPP